MSTTRVLAPEVVRRHRMERAVISALVKAGLEAGHTLGVHDGGEMVLNRSISYKAVMATIMAVDEEHLFFFSAETGKRIGWVFLVYGNDGWDVISDYTTNLEPIMDRPNMVSDRLQGC